MNSLAIVIGLVALAVGVLVGWVASSLRGAAKLTRVEAERDGARDERARVERELTMVREEAEELREARAGAVSALESAKRQIGEMQAFVAEVRQHMQGDVAEMTQKALERLGEFMKPHLDGTKGEIVSTLDAKKVEIEQLLAPLREMLDTYRKEVEASEVNRNRGYATINEQIRALTEATEATRREASSLATALGNPRVTGTWGEQSLERCVELAGMTAYCDFQTQESFSTAEGRIRPDMIVRLPQERVIAIDAKAPMSAYLEAAAESDEKRRSEFLDQHARNVRRHIDQLGSRDYHQNIGDSLDFTVLFLGGEQFLYAALSADPSLFDYGAEKKIFIATPSVLVPLLRVVAAAWRTEKTEENAKRVLEVGNELYARFVKVFGDIEGVGRSLGMATQKYNEAIRSIDARLIPKARELGELAASTVVLQELPAAEASIASVTKLAVVGESSDDDGEIDSEPVRHE